MSQPEHPTDPSTPQAVAAAAERFRVDHEKVREQVARVVVGQAGVIDGVLTIKAEHKDEREEKDEDKHYHLVERSQGTFLRTTSDSNRIGMP